MSVAVEFGTGSVQTVRARSRRHLRLVVPGEVAPALAGSAWAPSRPALRPAAARGADARAATRATVVDPRPVRLTLLGRRVVAAVVLVAALATAWAVLAPMAADALQSRAGSYSGATSQVVVLPGDTLWSIARTAQPGVDPRDTVLRIQKLNGLTDSEVSAGQRLVVPAAA